MIPAVGTLPRSIIPWVVLLAQAGKEDYWNRFARSFQQGYDPTPILLGLAVLAGVFISIYGILRALGVNTGSKKQYNILDALRENVRLSEGQNRYLRALIERFKNQNPHQPEVGTDYLREFFVQTIETLAQNTTQELRRQRERSPELNVGGEMTVMVHKGDTYSSVSFTIIGQDDRYVSLKPPDSTDLQLREGDPVEVCHQREHLRMRGEAEVKEYKPDKLILNLTEGLHFEEQRAYFRLDTDSFPCRLIVEPEEESKFTCKGTVEDLSLEGARVLVLSEKHDLHQGLRGVLKFDLPGHRELDLSSKVVRIISVQEDVEYELGLYFTKLTMGEREHLAQYIHENQPTRNA